MKSLIPKSALLALGLAAWAGCGIDADLRPLPPRHPASAEAAEGSYAPPENLLRSDLGAPKSEGGPGVTPHHGHGQAPAAPLRPYPLKVCLVGQEELGKMGPPVVIAYEGREIKFCCPACIATFGKDPAKYLKILDEADPRDKPSPKDSHPHSQHEEKK